jgi:hypothetical protein
MPQFNYIEQLLKMPIRIVLRSSPYRGKIGKSYANRVKAMVFTVRFLVGLDKILLALFE